MRPIFLLIIFILPLVSFSVSEGEAEFDYYPVDLQNVKSVKQLIIALDSVSPVRFGKAVYHGKTDWEVSWEYSWKEIGGVCFTSNVKTNLKSVYIMPRAINLPEKEKLKGIYLSYYEALLNHEKGHAKIASKAEGAINLALTRFAKIGNCNNVSKELNDLANEIAMVYKEKDRQYDIDTEHGKTEGAFLKIKPFWSR